MRRCVHGVGFSRPEQALAVIAALVAALVMHLAGPELALGASGAGADAGAATSLAAAPAVATATAAGAGAGSLTATAGGTARADIDEGTAQHYIENCGALRMFQSIRFVQASAVCTAIDSPAGSVRPRAPVAKRARLRALDGVRDLGVQRL